MIGLWQSEGRDALRQSRNYAEIPSQAVAELPFETMAFRRRLRPRREVRNVFDFRIQESLRRQLALRPLLKGPSSLPHRPCGFVNIPHLQGEVVSPLTTPQYLSCSFPRSATTSAAG
jgi:hypothetical protein